MPYILILYSRNIKNVGYIESISQIPAGTKLQTHILNKDQWITDHALHDYDWFRCLFLCTKKLNNLGYKLAMFPAFLPTR